MMEAASPFPMFSLPRQGLHRLRLERRHNEPFQFVDCQFFNRPTPFICATSSCPRLGLSGWSYHPHLTHFMTGEREVQRPGSQPPHRLYRAVQWQAALGGPGYSEHDQPHGLTQGLRGVTTPNSSIARKCSSTTRTGTVSAHVPTQQPGHAGGQAKRRRHRAGLVRRQLAIDRTNVVLRSTDFPKMKFNQFLLTPH